MAISVSNTPFLSMLDRCFDQYPFQNDQQVQLLEAFSAISEELDHPDLKKIGMKVNGLILRLEIFSAEVRSAYKNDLYLKMDKNALKAKLDEKRNEVYHIKQKLVDTELLKSFQSGKTLNLMKTSLEQVNIQYSNTQAKDREADTELTILEEAYEHADDPLYLPLRHKVIEEISYKIHALKIIREQCSHQFLFA